VGLIEFANLSGQDPMGYEVHITRAELWTDSDVVPIRLEEWLAYVEHDPEMRLDGFAEAQTTAGDWIRVDDESMSVWTKWSKHGVGGSMAWFSWFEGGVGVCHPDKEILDKMRQIAAYFHANVIGDDGEKY
jgi:hypothetical protein